MQKKNKWLFSSFFLKSLFCSLIGLFFYIIGRKAIPFPEKWMGASENHSLFFLGILNYLSVSWLLNYVFAFFNENKQQGEKIQKWKNRLNKALAFVFFIGSGLFSYWYYVESNLGKIAFLVLILAIVNCLLDSLIQWMNKNGVCNGFNLLLFAEFLPTRWISATLLPNLKNNWKTGNWISSEGLLKEPWFCSILLLFISVLFIWIINAKWEVPIETNMVYFSNNPLLQKYKSKLGFKMNFSFMSLYQLSQLLGWIFIFVKLISINIQTEGSNWLVRLSKKIGGLSSELAQKSITWRGKGEEKFWEKFFLLNNKKRIFGDLGQWVHDKKWTIILALFLLILMRWLIVWFSVRKFNLKTGDISDKLKKRGIYINHLTPGKSTRVLLKKVLNRLIFYWILLVLIFNIIFDQIFANMEKEKIKMIENKSFQIVSGSLFVGFLDWFGSVGIGIELYRQIRTKYKYSEN